MMADVAEVLLGTLRFHDDSDVPELRHRWMMLDLAGVAELAEYEGCVLWLYRRLKALGVVEVLPGAFGRWLVARARHVAAQNLRVDAQSEVIVRLLNSYGVPHVLLKGTARRRAAQTYPYADARATSDVDVLLPADLAGPTWERLRTAGFEGAAGPAQYNGHFHLPPLANELGIKVELHTSTSLDVRADEAWRRMTDGARVTRDAGGPVQIPPATELLWHALTHAAVSWSDAFRIRLLQDAAVVWASGEEIDWGEIAARLKSDEPGDLGLAKRWLSAAAWLSGIRTTDQRLGDLPLFDLPQLLRWRLVVFRLLSFGGSRGNTAVWGPHPVSRWRRLLIDEGTRAELRLPLTPPRWGATSLRRAGRRVAAAAARVCYCAWRTLQRLGT